MAANGVEMYGTTEALIDALFQVGNRIVWADKATKTFDLIRTAYGLFNNFDSPPDHAINLIRKIKELEKLLTLDLERHVALRNGREPYYFVRMDKPLQRVLDTVLSLEGESFPDRDFDHLAAEIQAAFEEYGLCTTLDTIFHENEAVIKLDALSKKLDTIEKLLGTDADASIALVQLHESISDLNGIRQSMTEENIQRLHKQFSQCHARIVRLENNLSNDNIQASSQLFLRYLAGQHLLRRPMVNSLSHAESLEIINGHMIHPGTRGWILERFNRCVHDQEKRLFYLSGKHGSGKTALASAVCKLNHSTVATHFFDESRGKKDRTNTVNGLIQAIAFEMCHTLPEYLNYLDDKFGESHLDAKLPSSWKDSYECLLKEPIQSLYGIGKSATKFDSRKLIVIDALDECHESEWTDLNTFLTLLVKDTPPPFLVFVTSRTKHAAKLLPPLDDDMMEGFSFEERAWINRHIKDIEIYLSSSLGAILSGEDEGDTPRHAKSDIMTLQNSIDELLKCSSGRFDYAIDLMETFAMEMSLSGQFLGSLKKALMPIKRNHGDVFKEKMGEFASPYRSYRDKEGRSVDIRVMRQSQYLKDKTRVALIRGRHRIQTQTQNGGQ